MQFDANTVGSASPAANAEVCMMAAEHGSARHSARAVSEEREQQKILDGLMEVVGLLGKWRSQRRLIVMSAIDKIDRLGYQGVTQFLPKVEKMVDGDVTPGADLPVTVNEINRKSSDK